MQEPVPPVTISQSELDSSGFTNSGKDRYIKGITEYADILFSKSISYGEIDKAVVREVTHDHVKAAAYSIANSFGRPKQTKWNIVLKIGQYLCAAFIGVATNHIGETYGSLSFVGAFCIGAILIYYENLNTK